MQTPFARYERGFRNHLIEVVLEVDKSKVYFFESKRFLNSQKIKERLENGNILLTYQITQELEIEELIKRWLPYIRVIEPLSLKEKIERELREKPKYRVMNRHFLSILNYNIENRNTMKNHHKGLNLLDLIYFLIF